MPYVLGIDVGTNHTTAALSRLDSPAEAVEIVRLSRSRALASVLYVAEDGGIVAGDAAAARTAADPARIVRGFLRRIGDDAPVLVGGESYTAQELTAMLVRWVVDQVVGQEGEPPEHIVLTHPASWGGYRRGLLHQELRVQGVGDITLLPEPIAVGEQRATERTVEAGATLAVYSLGEDVFSASIVRRVASGAFLVLARTESIDPIGGAHFTDLLLGQVSAGFKAALDQLDRTDPQARAAAFHLRQAAAQAKEQLSQAPDALVPVALPTVQQQVRVTRGAFTELIRPSVQATTDLLARTVRAAAVPSGQIGEVLLVGGSTRIPHVAEAVTAGLEGKDTVLVLDEAPELTVVKGAALAARRLATGEPAPMESVSGSGAVVVASVGDSPIQIPPGRGEPDEFGSPPPRPVVEIAPLELPEPRTASSLTGVSPGVLGAIVAVVVVAGVVLTFMFDKSPAAKPPVNSPLVHSTSYDIRSTPASPTSPTNPGQGGRS